MIDRLYDYQREAVDAALAVDVGTVVLPTGTGKTFCQAAIITNDILTQNKANIYVINCPRILLSFQLLKEVYHFLIASGIDARYMFVHSGGATDIKEMEEIRFLANQNNDKKIKFAQIESSTSSTEIGLMMKSSKQQNLPLVIFSTYHSCPRIENARIKAEASIRMIINDEAHYLTQEEFHKILSIVESEKRYFFTATARYTPSDEGRGMNNTDKYGHIVYSMTPREAIDLGKMVRPRIHTFFSPDINSFEDFQESVPKIIFEAFTHHEICIEELDSCPKILVSTKGVGDIDRFMKSDEYVKLRKMNIDIFAVASSEQISNNINGEKVNRKTFLRTLKKYGEDPSKRLIVLHYDILAEGIDISGFTAILPLRTLTKSKFLQTYGRCARLHPDDRKAFLEGSYNPSDIDQLKKPYAYVLAPNVAEGNEDDYENICSLIYQMREYDFTCIENIVLTDIKNGIVEIDEVNGLNDPDKKLGVFGEVIEKIESEREAEELASLNKIAKIKRTVRKKKVSNLIKNKKEIRITGYKVYSSKQEIKDAEGVLAGYCITVSKNHRNDVAAFILNNAGLVNLNINVHYYVDKANENCQESWDALMKVHPEYEGKFILPIIKSE